jgi:hypothetical protein
LTLEAASGWKSEMSDEEILAKLLELNLEMCGPALPLIRIESDSTIVEERTFRTDFCFV